MERLGYPSNLLYIDLGLILVSTVITYCMGLTNVLDEPAITWFFQFILYILDFSILLAVQVTIYLKDGVVVFHLYRLVGLLFAEKYEVMEVMLWPIIGFVLYRLVNLAINHKTQLNKLPPNEQVQGQIWWTREYSRRFGSVCVLAVITFVTVTLSTLHRYNNMTITFLTFLFLIFLGFEMRMLVTSQDYAGRIISNSLYLNVVIYLAICTLFGIVYHGDYNKYFEQCILYLSIAALIIRSVIGSQSYRFHKDDKELFQAIYQFSTQAISKRYRHKDTHKRLIKALDRVSRLMVYAVYFLACVVAADGSHYLWLFGAVLLMRAYPLENSNDDLFHYIQQKTGVKMRATILLPFILFAFSFYTRQLCHKATIYGKVTGCDSYVNWQFWIIIVQGIYTWLCQFLPTKPLRLQFLKYVAFTCPSMIFMLIYGYECQTSQLALLSFYCIALIFSIIRDDRLALWKGNKKQ